jgi:hypothetical protein
MTIGYHSRAMHAFLDPTSSPTIQRGSGHIETIAATDKGPGQDTLKGMARPKTLVAKAHRVMGERGDVK